MGSWCLSKSVRLSLLISFSSCWSLVAVASVSAQNKSHHQDVETKSETSSQIPWLREIELPATSAKLLVQQPAPTNPNPPSQGEQQEVVAITGVKANPTEKGVEVILETTQGDKLQVANRSTGNNFIADITGGQLRLASGDGFTFKSEKPIEGITVITVTNIDANTVRVTVVGEKTLPVVELFDDNAGLIFTVASTETATKPPETPPVEDENPVTEQPEKPQDDPIELVVTGEQDGYRVPNASTATRTDTPVRDIPQSIQVVPQQVLRDQQATRLEDALRNVPGVTPSFSYAGALTCCYTIRGFEVSQSGNNFLRDGLPDGAAGGFVELPNIEQVEVLKGPASVLFGLGSPGGAINLVTKRPLREPFYAIDATVGNYSFYRGAIDLSGPLNDGKTVLYRLNTAYRNSGSFTDFLNNDYFSISPVVSVEIGKNTNLTLEGEYATSTSSYSAGVPVVGTILPNPNGKVRRSFNSSEPSDSLEQTSSRFGYRLEHKFNDNWSLRNAFRGTLYTYSDKITLRSRLDADNRTFRGTYREFDVEYDDYSLTTNLVGKFSTGSIKHQLLVGVDLGRFVTRTPKYIDFVAAPLDIFNPIYGQPIGDIITTDSRDRSQTDSLGIYLQDQIALADNLKLLLGVRFDAFTQDYEFITDGTSSSQSNNAFSPRFGIVYQPIPAISLYAGYTSSFAPARGTIFFGNFNQIFEPERGKQYEVGVKADLSDRLSATLAFYDLTRTNVIATDPNDPNLSIQTGEQQSQGIEFNIGGEILPGWNIFAGYAYTDARLTKDTTFQPGNRLGNTPANSFNLWTTYQIQQGNLQGLGLGLGLFYVGDRAGTLENTYDLPSYLRTDAAIFYNKDKFRVALNFKNLFDIDYFEFASNSSRASYGQPFTVQGTISVQF
jgi:iron complex outermembrane recepter protein